MKNRTFSLRTKLLGAIAVIVSAASCPLIYIGYSDTYDRSVAAAEEKFGNLTRIVEEDLHLSYLNTQTVVTEKVAIEKDDIIQELNTIERAISSNTLPDFFATLKFHADAWGTYTAVVSEWGEYLYISPMISRMLRQNPKDYLGVTLRDYLRSDGSRFFRDYFTFFRFKTDDGRDEPYLVAVRKISGYTVVILQDVDYLEEQVPQNQRILEEHLNDTVKTLNIGPDTNFSIITGAGRIVASRGKGADKMPLLYNSQVRADARRDGLVTGVYERYERRELYSMAYFKALDWYIHASVPMQVIEAPAEAYARNLTGLVLAIFGLISMGGMMMVTWLVKPLSHVANTANALQDFNFLAEDTGGRLRKLTKNLPVQQDDEIGKMSRAFESMVLALEKNIADLKESVARQHNIEGELNAAREIQQGMLPPPDKGFRDKDFEAAAVMVAAKEVGGDFYDIFTVPDGRKALILGDVSGKGVSAALLMCVTLTLVRNALADGLSPASAMKKVNDQLAANNPSCMFVTLWIGLLNPETGALSYANGGHCPAVIVPDDPEKPLKWMRDLSGPLVGALDMAEFHDLEATLDRNEVCFVYTDGVSEAMNESRQLFGETGMSSVLETCRGASPQQMIDATMAGIINHRQKAEQSDDITMLVFDRRTSGEA